MTFVPHEKPRHAVIFCHPSEKSFTASVAQRYCETVERLGHNVVVRDLYRLDFDPVLKEAEMHPADPPLPAAADVARELEILQGTDIFVLVYPIWFGAPPALLKGYIDRVFGAGFPYGAVRDAIPHPLLGGKELISFTSSATTKAWLDEKGALMSLHNLFDTYLRHAFSLRSAEHVHFASIVDGLAPRFVNEHLFEVVQAARRICSGHLGAH